MKNGRFNFISIKTVLSKFYRDLKDTSIEEIDLIEWVGEAMGFMKNPQILEEAVAFLKVENNQTIIPNGFQAVIQVAKNNAYVEETKCSCNDECDCEIKIDRDKVCEKYQSGTQNVYTPLITFPNANVTVNISTSPNQIGISNNGGVMVGTFVNGGKITIGTCSTETYTVDFSNSGMIQLSGLPMEFMNCLVSTGILANLNNGTQNNAIPREQVLLQSKTTSPIYSHKQLIRIKKYNKNILTETIYEDCNGYAYTLIGIIDNCPSNICEPCTGFDNEVSIYDECGKKIMETTYAKYFSMKTPFNYWVKSNNYVQNYIPIRLSNHTFFNSVVCKLDNPIYNDTKYYPNTQDEYTIVGDYPNRVLRFSFQEGQVALAYLKSQTDDEGFPLIPDDSDCHSAIVYYLKWKIAERLAWSGREGYDRLGKEAEAHWLRYIKQFKSKSKMPYSLDDYKNIQENSYYLIPNLNKDFGFFGQLYK